MQPSDVSCSDVVCAVAGITSDANILIDFARLTCQRHEYAYHEPIPVEQLVQAVCNVKQSYTQHGGMRPFGVAFLYAGWDKHYGYQLYQSDPSGNYSGWQATSIGANSSTIQSIFKSDYEEDAEIGTVKKMLVKALKKTVEGSTLSGDKVELVVMQRTNNATNVQYFKSSEIEALVKECQDSMDTQ